ncbi:putative AAA family ATPase [Rosellinia necatrix]|uniref:Putative AAA family ATPase n=1 Tax=Rosellinia necatrix TaxID=77044 RepID=A0A1S8ABD0_ROSNE|nr:putative AAA family ATPase [Rosellinia necatrix]
MVNPTELGVAELTALIKDLHCLTRFMDGYIEPAMMTRQQDHVFFSDLWFVYPARSLIYIKDKKVPHKIWKVIQRTGGRWGYKTPRKGPTGDYMDSTQCFSPFVIDCFHLDYDGARYVHTYRQIQIDHFEGHQPVMSLPAIPIDVAQKAGFVDRQALVKRGKEFVECTQPSHRQYAGRNQILRPNGAKLHDVEIDIPENATRHAEWIESEVMVDFERALQEMPGWRPGINDLELYKTKEEVKTHRGVEIDNVWDSKLSEHVLYEEWTKIQLWDKARTHPTEDEDLLLLPDRVFAFVFRTRKWACLRIGTDKDSQETLTVKHRRKEPWLHLQLPDGHKRLIQSLVESHSADRGSSNVEFDLIRAKGKGLIILLHGVPGVGKTSTAECAAEAYNRPLLPITCGDLGSSPREVEKKLDEAFQLAQLWDCVLLLDEADIFLAQRSENDIARNALVSVFLRVLEYYEGILFLTTNRVGVFDEAFKSRIHLPLYYPPLEWKFAKQIWCTCLERLASSTVVEFDKEDILAYAETFFDKQNAKNSKIGPVWNGRQIRNAFQSAVALAGYQRAGDRFRLEREHFERVSKVSNEFNYYIWSIKTETDADKASRWGFRYDAFEVDETIHMKSVQPVAPTGMGGITFRPQFGNPGSIGMPLMNNPSQGPLQQGSFFNGMIPQPGAGPAGFTGMSNPTTNPTGGIIGSHLSQTGQGQLNQQFQQQAYQQQAYQQPTQQAYQQPTQQAYQQPIQLAHQQH